MNRLFTTLLFSLLLPIISANAAIVYRDITDGIPTGLDFNADGTNEFTISNDLLSGQGTYITYSLPCNVYGISSGQWDAAAALSQGASIGASGNWFGFGDCTVTGNSHPTTFPLNMDTYLGFKINLGGTVYYGWARVYVTANGTGPMGTTYLVTYKDYAYENTPNTPILAGDQGSLGIAGMPATDGIVVYTNPFAGTLAIENKNKGTITAVKITDITGKEVLDAAPASATVVLDVQGLKPGVYIVQWAADAVRGTKKIMINH